MTLTQSEVTELLDATNWSPGWRSTAATLLSTAGRVPHNPMPVLALCDRRDRKSALRKRSARQTPGAGAAAPALCSTGGTPHHPLSSFTPL